MLGNSRAVGKFGAIIGLALAVLVLLLLFSLAIIAPVTFVGLLLVFGGFAIIGLRPQIWWVGIIVLVLGIIAVLLGSASGGLSL